MGVLGKNICRDWVWRSFWNIFQWRLKRKLSALVKLKKVYCYPGIPATNSLFTPPQNSSKPIYKKKRNEIFPNIIAKKIHIQVTKNPPHQQISTKKKLRKIPWLNTKIVSPNWQIYAKGSNNIKYVTYQENYYIVIDLISIQFTTP